jgi:NO-binding membrane sensor protein with MHYT domain
MLIGVRVLWGSALLANPQAIVDKLTGEQADPRAWTFARILGTRHLAQAAIACRYHGRRSIVAGAAIDAMHATSMAILAVKSPDYRRPALVSTATATALCAAGLMLGLRLRRYAVNPATRLMVVAMMSVPNE